MGEPPSEPKASSSSASSGKRARLLSRVARSNMLGPLKAGCLNLLPSRGAFLRGDKESEAMLIGLGSAIWMSIGLGATSLVPANVFARVKGVRLDDLDDLRGLCLCISGESSRERALRLGPSSSASPMVTSEEESSSDCVGVDERFGGSTVSEVEFIELVRDEGSEASLLSTSSSTCCSNINL